MPICNLVSQTATTALTDEVKKTPRLPPEVWALIANHSTLDTFVALRQTSSMVRSITMSTPQLQHQLAQMKPYTRTIPEKAGRYSARFEEEKRLLLDSEFKNTIILQRNYARGRMRCESARHVSNERIENILFSYGSNYMATSHADGSLRIVEECGFFQPVHLDGGTVVHSAAEAFAPDDDCLVTIGRDRTVRFLLLPTKEFRSKIIAVRNVGSEIKGQTVAIAYAPARNGLLLACSGGSVMELKHDQALRLEDETNRKFELHEIVTAETSNPPDDAEETGDAFFDAKFTRDGLLLATQNECYNQLRLWDLQSAPVASKTITTKNQIILDFEFSSEGSFLAGVSDENDVYVWCTRTGNQVCKMTSNDAIMRRVVFSPDSQFLATVSDESEVCIWDLRDMKNPRSAQVLGIRQIGAEQSTGVDEVHLSQIVFSPDGRFLALAFSDGAVQRCDFLEHVLPTSEGTAQEWVGAASVHG
jgi:WD40 repeat protein